MTPKRGDVFIAYRDQRLAKQVYISVTRVARDGSWMDIRCQTWAVMWTKRLHLNGRGLPPEWEPYDWSGFDLRAQEADHIAMLRDEGVLS